MKRTFIFSLFFVISLNLYSQNMSDFEIQVVENFRGIPKGIFITKYVGNNVTVNIPSTINGIPVIGISSGAFSDEVFLKIIFPEGILAIYDYAFSYCTYLTEIIFPKSLGYIGQNAFEACIKLKEITFPEGSAIEVIFSGAFSGCIELEKIIIPNNSGFVLGVGAFLGCKNLKEVRLPGGLTHLYDRVFAYCENLESIYLPNSVTTIGESAFAYCKKLSVINLPTSLQNVGKRAFADCALLPPLRLEMERRFGIGIW